MLLLFWRASDALTASPSITLAFGHQVVSDSFTHADSSTSIGVAETGQAWTNISGTWGIVSETARIISGASVHRQATLDSGLADATIQVTISPSDAAQSTTTGILFRSVDLTNYIAFRVTPNTATATLIKNVAGSFSIVASASYTPSAASVLKVICVGPVVQCYVDGVLVISVNNLTDHTTATRHGLYGFNAPSTAFDDFSVNRAVWANVTLQTAQATPSIQLRLTGFAHPFGQASPSITLTLGPVLARQPARATPSITLRLSPVLARQPAQASPRITLALSSVAAQRHFATAAPSIRLALENHAIGGFTPAGSTVIELEYNASGSTVTGSQKITFDESGVTTITLSVRE